LARQRKRKSKVGRAPAKAASSPPVEPKPRWQRINSYVTAAILIPILVGLAIWGIEQLVGSALKEHGTPSASEAMIDIKPAHDVCKNFHVGIQCTLNELPNTYYVTRQVYHSMKGIPVCGDVGTPANAQFLRWAVLNAIPGDNNFLLDIASYTHSIVNLGTTQVTILKRYPSLTTDDIGCGGGADFVLAESINLDKNPPSVRYFCQNQQNQAQRECNMPQITLRKGDNLEILINAGNTRNVVEWTGLVNLYVNGHRLTLNLGTHLSASLPQPISCSPGGTTWLPCSRTRS